MMAIQDDFAFSLNKKDQGPNKALAERIVNNGGSEQLQELVDFFKTEPHKDLQKDAVLTMMYVAERSPEMLVPFVDLLLENFGSSINRVVWGSMIALGHLAHLVPDMMFTALPLIIEAMHKSTIVARDHGYRIMTKLYQTSTYKEDMFFVLLEQIRLAPPNQLGQYAERLMEVLDISHKNKLIDALEERYIDLSNDHHKRRLRKNLKKLNAMS